MFKTLVSKELKAIIQSPKFIGSFTICTLLILLSIYTGIKEYRTMQNQYSAASLMVDQELRQTTSWGRMNTKVYRTPDPMQIFVAGVDYDIGRWSDVDRDGTANLEHSAYSDDPIFAVFRFIDFAFIVQVVLTLFAILFTFNAVNGEREDGTLKLVFSNPVPRAKFLMAKCVGSWLGLVIPIMIPILLGLLLVIAYGVELNADHWIKLYLLIFMSILLFTFFIVLGVFISSVTRHSSLSFLISLVIWVLFVMIIPRTGVMAAGNLINVPRMAEIESRVSGYAKNKWDEFYKGMDDRWASVNNEDGNTELSEDRMWAMLEVEDSLRKEIEQDVEQYGIKLRDDIRQRKISQESLAFMMARLSPATAFQLGAMKLAETDIGMKNRYEDMINDYRNRFFEFVDKKVEETGDKGHIMMAVSIDDNGTQTTRTDGRKKSVIDVSTVPRFTKIKTSVAEILSPIIVDIGQLILVSLLTFFGAFIAFLKYDVR